jgi:hypothetical protein
MWVLFFIAITSKYYLKPESMIPRILFSFLKMLFFWGGRGRRGRGGELGSWIIQVGLIESHVSQNLRILPICEQKGMTE